MFNNPVSPYLGGQNFLKGCLLALNDSLTIIDGKLAKTDNFFAFDPSTTIADILDAAINDSICSSVTGRPPEVWVPYEWCLNRLPGWQSASLSGAMGPLVQFILPCIAFCYNIPREWKVRVGLLREKPNLDLGLRAPTDTNPTAPRSSPSSSSSSFSRLCRRIGKSVGVWANGFVILVAVTFELGVLALDTLLWMAICFVMAGPMIISAAYEYRLDWKNLDMLAHRGAGVPNVSRARLLLCTVAGNMKMRDDKGKDEEEGEEMGGLLEAQGRSAWVQIMSIAEEDKPQAVSQVDGLGLSPFPGRNSSVVAVEAEGTRVGPRLKLQTLLDAQPGFGGYIGAPTVFFIGSFGYNIADSDNSPGQETVAITLAFGMFWMYIPHTAVISNTLLASNDPSTLQGLVGKKAEKTRQFQDTQNPGKTPLERLTNSSRRKIHDLKRSITKPAYESTYEPVAMWKRGPNKQSWMFETIKVIRDIHRDDCPPDAVKVIESALVFGRRDWAFALSLTLLLLSIPYVLAFTTSYLTPMKGLSCRSLTHTVFFLSQCIQVAIWSFDTHRTVDAWSWIDPTNPNARAGLSNITEAEIRASKNWNINGALASVALSLVTAVGWWHRRELWKKFTEETMKLPDVAAELSSSKLGPSHTRLRRTSSIPSNTSEPLDMPLLDPSRSPG
ncbi:hypothetical protein M406DRAFT_328680 [Cryphonectria parasitica EP155]|uniref:Uncharacterized protein n=1 Tax=Cryphonectria parasitica (strain ATCC 38755 / EP155) TaxID=660469 RepID=A0A9P4Y7P3_CRYP1|nr:uncharacterized protein M406DRAFT_328680 [Cryphonectria parasitica EP155]KAF3767610.1 hypothetical protein M406DRAFT_328680 [Cryphonectria parasitica EP155]